MLAILLIKMKWTKESRTPQGAVKRQQYYKPVKIEEDVPLSGDGIFLTRYEYDQQGDMIFDVTKTSKQFDQKRKHENAGMPFTQSDEHEQKMARNRNQQIQREKGAFYAIEKLEIPCIEIREETNNHYRIKWFDSGLGMPKRRGGNEDLYRKGAKLCGRTNTCNETAFLLKEGEAGVLKYNYRLTRYCGQWYECYYVYVVHTKELSRDVFLREYDYEYNQLADLF